MVNQTVEPVKEDFYALLSQSTRDELASKLPESVSGLAPAVINALQEYGEEVETGEDPNPSETSLGDFGMYISLAEDEDEGEEGEDE